MNRTHSVYQDYQLFPKFLLATNNYVVVKDFIHQDGADQIGKEFRKYCVDSFAKADTQVPGSPAVYNHPLIHQLLFSKIFYMNDLIGERLYPTYCYARWYKTGAELKQHTDAEACEISVSVNLFGDPWAIYFTKPDNTIESVTLNPGDAVIYKGVKSVHWREKFTGKECVQAFLHYVTIHGPNYLHAFDLARNPNGFV
jgi:hypothetical protein